MIPKDVVFLSMSTWREWQEGIVNRSRHILGEMQKQGAFGRILYVDFPPRTYKAVLRRFLKDTQTGGKKIAHGFGWYLQDIGNDVAVLTTYWFFSEQKLKDIVKRCTELFGFLQPTLWSYNPLLPAFFEEKYFSKKIFDAVDDWRDHPAYANDISRLNFAYENIGKNADIIFTVSKKLTEVFPIDKVHCISNGVDLEFFQKTQFEPDYLKNISHPRIGYTGVIQSRLDFDLLKNIVKSLPDFNFIFIGWVWNDVKKDVEELSLMPNVYFLGRKKYEVLPAYLQHIDVGIIPHRVEGLAQSMDPLKLYEYLACGKPVVMTKVPLAVQSRYIFQATNVNDFCEFLAKAVVLSKVHMSDVKELTYDLTWVKRVQKIISLL